MIKYRDILVNTFEKNSKKQTKKTINCIIIFLIIAFCSLKFLKLLHFLILNTNIKYFIKIHLKIKIYDMVYIVDLYNKYGYCLLIKFN